MAEQTKKSIIDSFKLHDGDTGSSQVQVALITDRINALQGHFKDHKKDHASKRGLLKLIARRKNLLAYIKKHDVSVYKDVISRLGLRK